jgi:hypothetical protein
MKRFRLTIPTNYVDGKRQGGILHSDFKGRLGEGWQEINGYEGNSDYTFFSCLISTPDDVVKEDVEDLFPEATVAQIPDEIDTRYTRELTCPYCGCEAGDSWEVSGDDGDYECGDCGETFLYSRHVEVTYCTRKAGE